ncbi:hypothetical protein C8R45DRAFT_1192339 [Mycena sanguinolenta]|nr:hypothetical protein C8R45DRAFT_1192339 [Mycena sanguinolenta]
MKEKADTQVWNWSKGPRNYPVERRRAESGAGGAAATTQRVGEAIGRREGRRGAGIPRSFGVLTGRRDRPHRCGVRRVLEAAKALALREDDGGSENYVHSSFGVMVNRAPQTPPTRAPSCHAAGLWIEHSVAPASALSFECRAPKDIAHPATELSIDRRASSLLCSAMSSVAPRRYRQPSIAIAARRYKFSPTTCQYADETGCAQTRNRCSALSFNRSDDERELSQSRSEVGTGVYGHGRWWTSRAIANTREAWQRVGMPMTLLSEREGSDGSGRARTRKKLQRRVYEHDRECIQAGSKLD